MRQVSSTPRLRFRAFTVLAVFPATLGALVLACSGGDKGPPAGGAASTSAPGSGVTASTSAATASGAPTAAGEPGATGSGQGTTTAPSAASSGGKTPRYFEAVKAELAKKCPVEAKTTNVDQKEAALQANQCLRKHMIADLDAVLVPLKKTDKARFDTLMKEQAEWNRAMEMACDVEEERFWLDLETGRRDDGTMRGYTWLGCYSKAYTERILYARALGARKTAPLAKRILSKQKEGAEVAGVLADIAKRAGEFMKAPPKVEPGELAEDWKKLADEIGKVQAASKSMAKSTCASWPEIAKDLGPKNPCEPALTLYYFAQGNEPKVQP